MLNVASLEPNMAQATQRASLNSVNLLLVEDNEMDVKIFRRALFKSGLSYPVTVAHDGLEALSILRGENETLAFDRPTVVLLDLHMPRMNGHEFLEEMRADPKLTDLIVFVLTTSDAPNDKTLAYRQHIAGYLLKSISGPTVEDAIQMIDHFTNVVELPH